MARFEALLEATEALLQTDTPDNVGLYQIAERAGVPPASVYHFFPTKEAAYQALAVRFLDKLLVHHREQVDARRIATWQALFEVDMRRAVRLYNADAAILKILYGGYGGVEARAIDTLVTNNLAAASYARLDRIFHMPIIRNAERKFGVRLSILDGVCSMSVQRHGTITEDYVQEILSACIAYTRTFLPEVLERRDWFNEAFEAGRMVSLPYDDPEAEAALDGGA